MKWVLTSPPVISISGGSPSSGADAIWRIATAKSGKATVTYERNVSFDEVKQEWKAGSSDSSIYVRGDISLQNGQLKVTVDK